MKVKENISVYNSEFFIILVWEITFYRKNLDREFFVQNFLDIIFVKIANKL